MCLREGRFKLSTVVHHPLLILAAFAVLFGCATPAPKSLPAGAWKAAVRADTIEAYQDFLERHPEGAYAVDARNRIGVLRVSIAWERASQADIASAYTDFIKQHPGSDLVGQAESSIDDLEWEQAEGVGTAGSCEAYLRGATAEFWLKIGSLEVRLPGNHVDAAGVCLAEANAQLAALDFDRRWVVYRAQAGLREWGYDGVDLDGVWGPTTRAAITAFQAARHLSVTGLLDDGTKKALAHL